jgi:hypothetical protein
MTKRTRDCSTPLRKCSVFRSTRMVGPICKRSSRKPGRRYAQSIGEDYDPNPFTGPPHQGGYQHITPAEWAAWDQVNAEWQAQRRALRRPRT